MTYRAAIIEDDPLSLQVLIDLLGDEFSEIDVVGSFPTLAEAQKGIPALNLDLVFLDMELPDGKGFDLLTALESINFEVIITTMHDSYMLEAIKHSAIDYLMKPLDKQGLRDALSRFEQRSTKKQNTDLPAKINSNRLVIPNQDGLLLVEIKDIIRLESDGAYTHMFLADGGKHMTSKNLGYYEKQLDSQSFFRVHHSHLVNMTLIKKYVRGEGGLVVMVDNSEVAVSRRKKEEFLMALGV